MGFTLYSSKEYLSAFWLALCVGGRMFIYLLYMVVKTNIVLNTMSPWSSIPLCHCNMPDR